MSLRTEYEATGAWLFRHRSFLPLLALPILIEALRSFTYLWQSHQFTEIWAVFSLMISFLGLFIRAFTVGFAPQGTSGRNTRQQVAEVLNTTGMYSLVRHPLYLGNYLAVLGAVVFFHTWWLVLLLTCLYALYYERIMFAEEAFLRQRFGESFEQWAAVTPAVVPKLRGWKHPGLTFSWRTVLRREYTGFFLITASFCALEIAGDSVAEQRLRIDWPWCMLFALGVLVYLVLRTLKKKTRMLDVPGR
ncbi:MAG: hypothetical protein KIT22_09650 [Verrucomicrobiae bacterium]|nr:hypothetical protein [Verrucomicrobiae bacterium]